MIVGNSPKKNLNLIFLVTLELEGPSNRPDIETSWRKLLQRLFRYRIFKDLKRCCREKSALSKRNIQRNTGVTKEAFQDKRIFENALFENFCNEKYVWNLLQ